MLVMSQSHGAFGSTETKAFASFGGLRGLMHPEAIEINANAINKQLIFLMKPPWF
jgi:hypothetical protein